jgi:hypothetical protein
VKIFTSNDTVIVILSDAEHRSGDATVTLCDDRQRMITRSGFAAVNKWFWCIPPLGDLESATAIIAAGNEQVFCCGAPSAP